MNKRFSITKLMLVLTFLFSLFALVGCKENEKPDLSFSKVELEVKEGESFTLNPAIKNLENGAIEYTFDKDGIVEIKNGNEFVAKKAGTVKITASLKDYSEIKVEITVKVVAVSEAKLVQEIKLTGNNELKVGEETTLTAEVLPSDADNKEVSWKVSDETILSVENGKVKALKVGAATVTCEALDGSNVKADLEITVKEVESYKTIKEVIEAKEGEFTIKGIVAGLSSSAFIVKDETGMILVYKGYSWECDLKAGDEVVVSGTVSAYGKAIQFGQEATYEKKGEATAPSFEVKELNAEKLTELAGLESLTIEYVKVAGKLSISGNYVNLNVEGTEVVGSLLCSKEMLEVVKALDGQNIVVTGFGSYISGKNKYYNIIVTDAQVDGFAIVGETEISVGDDAELTVVGATEAVTWESSDETVIQVVDGLITALKKGTATITAKSGDKTATIEITVLGKVYTVKFVEKDGKTVLSEQKIEEGEAAVAPEAPEIEEYVFVKWDKSFDKVTRNLTIKPLYGLKRNINYVLDGGTLPEGTPTVFGQGYAFTLPQATKKGYLFAGWALTPTSKDYMTRIPQSQKEDITLYAKYIKKNYYEITFNFAGGVADDLYKACGSEVAQLVTDNYNYNNGAFWAGQYAYDLFIGDSSHDPGATFSDRIYIGKDKYTGVYKVINILNSGTSSWPAGAEYVITISTSYSTYRTQHAKVMKISVGDVVAFSKDFTLTTKNQPTTMFFYKPEIEGSQITIKVDKDTNVMVPGRLGFNFLGWFDEEGKKYDSFADFDDDITVTAKWEELTPVTDIKVENMVTEMLTTDTIDLKAEVIPSDAFFKTIFFQTSDKDIINITSDGRMIAKNAGKATITITDYAKRVTKTYEINVYPVTSIDLTFSNGYNGSLKINEKMTVKPVAYGKDYTDAKFIYSVDNMDVVSCDASGNVTALKEGTAIITVKDEAGKCAPVTFGVVVNQLSQEDKINKVMSLLIENNFSVVQTGNACLYNDGTNRYYDSVYGSVNNYLFDKFEIIRKYEEQATKNENCHKDRRPTDQIEFVTVHDTATLTGTSESIAQYMSSGETSIHYTVGNDVIYSVVPEKFIAYHAGDGTYTTFEWIPSGVKAESNTKPDIDLTKSGDNYYFVINGQTSTVVAPISGEGKTIQNPSKANLPVTGPVWKVVNGEYYLGTSWVCFSQNISGIISNHGGNNNSIGIEMNVNTSNDTYDSWQRTARLVADILIRNNLDLTRVMMHNNWSGKGCPQVFISGNYWSYFMKMVELNYTLQKYYSDVEISMKSNNPKIVDETGRVVNAPATTTTVSYEITVKAGSDTKTVTLYSVIPGTTTWDQWDGTYPSSKVWNGGNFVR